MSNSSMVSELCGNGDKLVALPEDISEEVQENGYGLEAPLHGG